MVSILDWQADSAFCTIEPTIQNDSQEDELTEQIPVNERVVNELLKKVKKRRNLVRSYTYFSWFCIFFVSYLGNLYIKTVI